MGYGCRIIEQKSHQINYESSADLRYRSKPESSQCQAGSSLQPIRTPRDQVELPPSGVRCQSSMRKRGYHNLYHSNLTNGAQRHFNNQTHANPALRFGSLVDEPEQTGSFRLVRVTNRLLKSIMFGCIYTWPTMGLYLRIWIGRKSVPCKSILTEWRRPRDRQQWKIFEFLHSTRRVYLNLLCHMSLSILSSNMSYGSSWTLLLARHVCQS